MRDSGVQIARSALPVLTYLNVRSAPVLDLTIFGALSPIWNRTPGRAGV